MSNIYNKPIPDYGDLMTKKDFLDDVDCEGFIDYDGFGFASLKDVMSDILVKPSSAREDIPEEATHVVWFNR